MKTYTVLLMYPDYLAEPHYGEETWLWVGEAHDAGQALARAQCDARDNNEESEAEDFAHVITFEGACEQVARHGLHLRTIHVQRLQPLRGPRVMVIEDLMGDEPEFLCTGCGRPEDDCSRDPCSDVIADRGEYTTADYRRSVWFDASDPIERAYRSTQP